MADEPDLTSLVDFLKSHGVQSDFAARRHIAERYDIIPYTGTAAQNAHLLAILKTTIGAELSREHADEMREMLENTFAGRLWRGIKARLRLA
jgi:hypothetical protein